MKILRTLAAGLVTGVMMTGACLAQGSANYPSGPVKLIVPFPPGGAVDTLARKASEDLRQRLNATVVVENKPGAGTQLGTDFVAKAPKDGQTMLINAPGGIEQLPWLQKLPYDPMKDLQPVSMAVTVPVALIVPSSSPIKNFQDFVQYAKAHKGKMSYGSLGNGSTAHIFGATLSAKVGADAVHSAYKGDAPAMLDLVAGRLSYLFNNIASSIQFRDRGSVRILAVSGPSRLAALPDVPTLSELGMEEFEPVGWFAFFMPAGTPRPVVEKMHDALAAFYKTKDFADYLATSGLTHTDLSVDQFTAQVHDEYKQWGQLVKANNIRIE